MKKDLPSHNLSFLTQPILSEVVQTTSQYKKSLLNTNKSLI